MHAITAAVGKGYGGGPITRWKANTGVTTSGSNVTVVQDLTSLRSVSQATSGQFPQLLATPTRVDHNGTTQWLSGPAGNIVLGPATKTIFVVCQWDTAVTGGTGTTSTIYFNSQVVGDGSAFWGVYARSAGKAGFYTAYNGTTANFVETNYTIGTKVIVEVRQLVGTIGIRVNGGTEVTAATNGATANMTGAVWVGKNGNGPVYFDGFWQEIVLANYTMDSTALDAERTALATTYGITLL